MKQYDPLWNKINNLLATLSCRDIDLIDGYYLGYGNSAPGELLRAYIKDLQKELDEASPE